MSVRFQRLHSPGLHLTDARSLQEEFAHRVAVLPLPMNRIHRVTGLDVSSSRFSNVVHAAAVTVDRLTGAVLESTSSSRLAEFPYVPGYLAFREAPPLLDCLNALSHPPDVLLVDGNGVLHPRRFGVACYLGLATGIPTIGCAKSLLCGTFETPKISRGAWSAVRDSRGALLGRALRTRDRVKPIFLSVGHRCDLDTAMTLVLELARFRVPQPIRLAHDYGNAVRRGAEAEQG